MFYDGLTDLFRNRVDLAAGGMFYSLYEDEVYLLIEKITETDMQQSGMRISGRDFNPRRGGILNVVGKEAEVERDMNNYGWKETNKKLEELTLVLKDVFKANSPLSKAKICSMCSSRDHEDGAFQKQEEEEVNAMNFGQEQNQWQQQGNQGSSSYNRGPKPSFQQRTNFVQPQLQPPYHHQIHHQPAQVTPSHLAVSNSFEMATQMKEMKQMFEHQIKMMLEMNMKMMTEQRAQLMM